MKKYEPKKIREFLKESNAIERVYSEEAFEDALEAWDLAYTIASDAGANFKFTSEYVDKIHAHLMRRQNPGIAGRTRTCNVTVGGKPCMKPEFVNIAMRSWCAQAKLWSYVTNFELPKASHIIFEKIHPYEDGNGRVGRILFNIMNALMNKDLVIIHEAAKEEYYEWFR